MELFGFGLDQPSPETSKDVLGGKGAGLVRMDKLGVRIPPGFVIPTQACAAYRQDPDKTMTEIAESMLVWLDRLKNKFGYMPLLSVRSGAPVSMPGMMDTILNVGLDGVTVSDWVNRIGEDCVRDCRRRLISMYGDVVKGLGKKLFEGKGAVECFVAYRTASGEDFPYFQEQLLGSVAAVFRSWDNERAKTYRKLNGISEMMGTAVVVQAMVFGNMNEKSCTGVLFTRNPDTGENSVTGEFLVKAQGEDVVAGTATPLPLSQMAGWDKAVSEELRETVKMLETVSLDVQDVEFTVQDGTLYVLQTRTAKRSARAAVRIAVEMVKAGTIDKKEAFRRVSYREWLLAQTRAIDPKFKMPPAATGIAACGGIVTGIVVHTAEAAVKRAKEGVVLVTEETTPDDLSGMIAAKALLTMRGGATSHAAVVARSMNKPCVVGLGAPMVAFPEDTVVSIDGSTGRVWQVTVPTVDGADDLWVRELNGWMLAESGARLAGDTGGLLDVSHLTGAPKAAAKLVSSALKKKSPVIVDVRQTTGHPDLEFYRMFPQDTGEEALLRALRESCAADKVSVLTNLPVTAEDLGLRVVRFASSPEDLVMAQGDFVVSVSGEWVDKLVGWKRKLEGVSPLRLGHVGEGGVASMPQIASGLLR